MLMMFATLAVEDVLLIHESLVADFAAAADPIAPAGVKDMRLLESAIGRQYVGSRSELKYPNPIENAATLLYGICNNHPFHNGNKRTAVVAMLAHLDKNGLTLMDTREKELFDLIIAVASHGLTDGVLRVKPTKGRRVSSDDEVAAIAAWIRKRAGKPQRGERQITFRELRRLLGRFAYEMDSGSARGNSADIFKLVEERSLLGKKRLVRKRIGVVGYRNEGTFVSIKDIKNVRRLCHLTDADGIDSDGFYDQAAIIDAFINKYRTTLRRLSRR